MSNDEAADNGALSNENKVVPTPSQPVDPPAFLYIPPYMVRELQISEADTHQQIVDAGRIWQYYPILGQTTLPTTTMTAPGIQLEDEELQWTNDHKSVFIELIGRWSASALPEIAQTIKKPLFECQHYLKMLRDHPRCIDAAEIPAAEEVPPEYIEPDIVMSEKTRGRKKEVAVARRPFLFQKSRLESRFKQTFTQATVNKLEDMLIQKLRVWLVKFAEQYATAGHLCKDHSKFIEEIVMAESEINFPEWMNDPHFQDDPRIENCDADAGSDLQVNAAVEHDQEDPVDENAVDDLLDQETNWLENLDYFNSNRGMQSRGIPLLPVPPPPNRTSELMEFMWSR